MRGIMDILMQELNPGPQAPPFDFKRSPFPSSPQPAPAPTPQPAPPQLRPVSVPNRELKMADPQVQSMMAAMNAPALKSVSGGPTSGRGAMQQPGLLSRLGRGAIDYLSDPINRKQLAIGFNAMRLNPDANLAKSLQSQIETEQGMRLLRTQGNKTAEALEKAAEQETDPSRKRQLSIAANLVRENPSLAKEGAAVLFDTTSTLTEGFRTKHLSAIAAGLSPGSPEYRKAMGAESSFGGLSETQLDGITGIRKEFAGLPEVKGFQEQVNAYGRIISSAEDPSAAGDLALIFNFMKLLDPGSVVRESEFRTAQDAKAWLVKTTEDGIRVPGPIVTAIQKAETGMLLLPEQRNDFVRRSERLYSQAESSFVSNYENQYKNFMSPYLPENADIADYFPSFRYRGKTAAEISQQGAGSRLTPTAVMRPNETPAQFAIRLQEEAARRGL